jgi:hypothetical protein
MKFVENSSFLCVLKSNFRNKIIIQQWDAKPEKVLRYMVGGYTPS